MFRRYYNRGQHEAARLEFAAETIEPEQQHNVLNECVMYKTIHRAFDSGRECYDHLSCVASQNKIQSCKCTEHILSITCPVQLSLKVISLLKTDSPHTHTRKRIYDVRRNIYKHTYKHTLFYIYESGTVLTWITGPTRNPLAVTTA